MSASDNVREPMATGKTTTQELDERWLGLLVSLLIHLALFAAVVTIRPEQSAQEPLPFIDVSIEPQVSQPDRPAPPQIVAPSDVKSAKEPLDTRLLSERDSSVEREQIKRGTEGGPAPSKASEPRNEPPAPKPKERTVKSEPQEKVITQEDAKPRESSRKAPPKPKAAEHDPEIDAQPEPDDAPAKPLTKLRLDSSTLVEKFGKEAAAPKRSSPEKPRDLGSYEAFTRPPGSGASFLGTGGVSDHLPNLPDGDITLLNAKASTYAGFVRRVAIQVFAALRSQGWEQLSRYEIQQMSGFATIEAVMSKGGKLINARLIEGSGSRAFDIVLNQAVTHGVRDPNPPAGAEAKDGNIHFIFKARSWSDTGSSPRSRAPFERRWLLLATGLE